LEKSEAYPAQLQTLLRDAGWNATVVNAGRSGDTSAQGLRRLDWNLKQGPFDLVILALGANDGLRRMDLESLEKNLSQMIERFTQNKSRILLCGLKLPINYDPKYRERFEGIFPKLAKQHRLTLLPFLLEDVALSTDLNLNDLIHPNAEGHRIIARRLLTYVVPELEKLPLR